MNRTTSLLVAALLAAFTLPNESLGQFVKNTNQSRKLRSVLVGGSANLISSNVNTAFIGGGQNNKAGNTYATVAGGAFNESTGYSAAVGGGNGNIASGSYATVPGGLYGRATNNGSFVWSGVTNTSPGVITESTNAGSFTVRAPGGVRFISTFVDSMTVTNGAYNTNNNTTALTNGVYLAPNSGAWASLSDSNAKTGIKPIDARKILSKVVSMPVTEWKYKVDPDRRYIGPMAQDFRAAFGLGFDDKSISTLDSDGVMYAAIQGLFEELKERDKAMTERDEKIGKLETELRAIRERLADLPPQ